MQIPNPADKISVHFTWKDALYLPSWNRMAGPSDGVELRVLSNLQALFAKMDIVRDYIGKPIIVHVAYRPAKYNEEIGGASKSAHLCLDPGIAAVDFHVQNMSCRLAKIRFMEKLDEWNLRMENNGQNASWVHLDNRPVTEIGHRFFKP